MLSLRVLSQIRPAIAAIRNVRPLVSSLNHPAYGWSDTQLSSNTQLRIVRHYAKSKDKQSEKGRNKGGYANFKLSKEQLSEIFDVQAYREKLEKIVAKMQEDYIQNLSIRSSTGSLEALKVKVDGKVHELQELAQISRKGSKVIVLNMIGFPQTIPAVLQAIRKSGMNLNPQQEGTTLFIPVPKVTKDHRTNLSKNAKALYIKYRDEIKNVQNDAIRRVKKNTDISEDVNRAVQAQLTSAADEYVEQAEKMMKTKQKELLPQGHHE